MIYDSLKDIADNFDLFIFDAYGVFWEGKGFYPNSHETMHSLIEQGKTVVVLSNTTQLQKKAIENYAKRGLFLDHDYNFLMTSGDLLRKTLVDGKLKFASCEHPKKYFVIGKPHPSAFINTPYLQTNRIEDADFIYCGVPFMFPENVKQYPEYQDKYLPVQADDKGEIILWNTLTAEPFVKQVEQAVALKLPVLNANPDFTAKEGHPLIPELPAAFVIRNGSIAQMFREQGAEVLEFGKPHTNIYNYAFSILNQQGLSVNKERTCMIGDTVRTDIKGGVNIGITPILCTETGVTAEEISVGNSVKKLCLNENIDVQQIIQIKSVGGNS